MPFDIEKFRSTQNTYNAYTKTNKFLVRMTAPQLMLGNSADSVSTTRDLEYFCQDAVLPGYQLMTGNVRRYGYGPNEVRVHGPNFQQVQLLFNADGLMKTWKYFSDWLETIVPHDSSRSFHSQSIRTGGKNYEISYKSEYVTDIEIHVFDEIGKTLRIIVLKEAFPSNINQIQMSWGNTNEIMQFNVFIEYLEWHELPSGDFNIPT